LTISVLDDLGATDFTQCNPEDVGKSFSMDTEGCFPRVEVARVWTWPL